MYVGGVGGWGYNIGQANEDNRRRHTIGLIVSGTITAGGATGNGDTERDPQ